MASYKIGSFTFTNESDARRAKQELQLIENLKAKTDVHNPDIAKQLLAKCKSNGTFKTNVGIEFLNDLEKTVDDFDNVDNILTGINSVAEPSKRFWASLIDFYVSLPINIFIFVLTDENNYVGVLIASVIYYLIFGFFWCKGQSVGKSIMKLKVIHKKTNEKLSLGSMILREVFGKFISALIVLMGYVWILLDKEHQGWHDKLVNSVVVYDVNLKKSKFAYFLVAFPILSFSLNLIIILLNIIAFMLYIR